MAIKIVPIGMLMTAMTYTTTATMTTMNLTVWNRASPIIIANVQTLCTQRHRIYYQNDRQHRLRGAGAPYSVRQSNALVTTAMDLPKVRSVRTQRPRHCQHYCNVINKRNTTPIKISSTNCDTALLAADYYYWFIVCLIIIGFGCNPHSYLQCPFAQSICQPVQTYVFDVKCVRYAFSTDLLIYI